jgi:hypothetical protein
MRTSDIGKIARSISSRVTGILGENPSALDTEPGAGSNNPRDTGPPGPKYPSDPRILNLIFETKARIDVESNAPTEDLHELLQQVGDVLRVRSALRFSHPAKLDHSAYQSYSALSSSHDALFSLAITILMDRVYPKAAISDGIILMRPMIPDDQLHRLENRGIAPESEFLVPPDLYGATEITGWTSEVQKTPFELLHKYRHHIFRLTSQFNESGRAPNKAQESYTQGAENFAVLLVARALGISVAQKYVEDLWEDAWFADVDTYRHLYLALDIARFWGIDSLNQGERSPESIDRTLSESELRTYTKDLQGRVDRFISELRENSPEFSHWLRGLHRAWPHILNLVDLFSQLRDQAEDSVAKEDYKRLYRFYEELRVDLYGSLARPLYELPVLLTHALFSSERNVRSMKRSLRFFCRGRVNVPRKIALQVEELVDEVAVSNFGEEIEGFIREKIYNILLEQSSEGFKKAYHTAYGAESVDSLMEKAAIKDFATTDSYNALSPVGKVVAGKLHRHKISREMFPDARMNAPLWETERYKKKEFEGLELNSLVVDGELKVIRIAAAMADDAPGKTETSLLSELMKGEPKDIIERMKGIAYQADAAAAAAASMLDGIRYAQERGIDSRTIEAVGIDLEDLPISFYFEVADMKIVSVAPAVNSENVATNDQQFMSMTLEFLAKMSVITLIVHFADYTDQEKLGIVLPPPTGVASGE